MNWYWGHRWRACKRINRHVIIMISKKFKISVNSQKQEQNRKWSNMCRSVLVWDEIIEDRSIRRISRESILKLEKQEVYTQRSPKNSHASCAYKNNWIQCGIFIELILSMICCTYWAIMTDYESCPNTQFLWRLFRGIYELNGSPILIIVNMWAWNFLKFTHQ